MNTQVKETAPSLVVRRVIRAKRDRVFQAWTNPEMMNQWFVGGNGRAEVTNNLKVGGTFRNEMVLDGPKSSGEGCSASEGMQRVLHTGEYLEIVPPEKIVFTWSSPSVQNSRVTVELKDLGDSTEVWITHDNLETEGLREGHSKGWNACLSNLQTFIEN